MVVNYFVVSLAFADLFNSLVTIPYTIGVELSQRYLPADILCKCKFVFVFVFFISVDYWEVEWSGQGLGSQNSQFGAWNCYLKSQQGSFGVWKD